MRHLLIPVASAVLLSAAVPAHADTAVLAGGCFWGMESVFEHVKGVQDVVSGFAGGSARDANYDSVSTERTGHAEAVRITYDPKQISYGQLLQIFFTVAHDPTQVNRQGPDTGPSYRSAIFPQTPGASVHRQNGGGPCLQGADRDEDRERRLLSCRGLSPGLCPAAPILSVYRDQRSAEGGFAESPLPGLLQGLTR